MDKRIEAILFTDVSGYSRLEEPQLKSFMEHALPDIAALFDEVRDKFTELNTWGDAIVAVAADPYMLSHLALDLRDFFRNRNWKDDHLPSDLAVRVALHAGTVFVGKDPIRNSTGIIGTQVNLAARVEPVTSPNEVWVTDQFMKLIDTGTDEKLAFDDLGDRPLAKKFGSAHLWHLRRQHEPKKEPTDIIVQPIQGPAASKELEVAIHMARHGSEEQRVVGLDLLDQFNVSESISALVEVARDKTAAVQLRQMAIASLGKLRARTAVPDLVAIVDDAEELPHVVGQTIEVLGNIRDVRALPAIQNAVLGERELEPNAISAAITAIGKIGDSKGVPLLKGMLENPARFQPYLDRVIASCAALPDSTYIPHLQDIARDKSLEPLRRCNAIEALLFNTPTQSADLFVEIAKDKSETADVQFMALGALAAVPSASSKAVLHEIASDLSNPLCTRALVILTKGASLLKEQKERFTRDVKGV